MFPAMKIFKKKNISEQPKVKANIRNDVLIVFSGSGNSVNVTKALERGNRINMVTFRNFGG